MGYKRLTDEKEHYKKCVGCSYRNCQYCEGKYEYAREFHKRLAKLEDKIEQGTLIELPIPYNAELHFLYSREHYGKPQPACVHSSRKWIFSIGYDGETWFSVAGRGIGYYGNYTHKLGETVFLTREEAEKRLKELQ